MLLSTRRSIRSYRQHSPRPIGPHDKEWRRSAAVSHIQPSQHSAPPLRLENSTPHRRWSNPGRRGPRPTIVHYLPQTETEWSPTPESSRSELRFGLTFPRFSEGPDRTSTDRRNHLWRGRSGVHLLPPSALEVKRVGAEVVESHAVDELAEVYVQRNTRPDAVCESGDGATGVRMIGARTNPGRL